ncbi:unnamed protein product, partial [Tuber aestivum]
VFHYLPSIEDPTPLTLNPSRLSYHTNNTSTDNNNNPAAIIPITNRHVRILLHLRLRLGLHHHDPNHGLRILPRRLIARVFPILLQPRQWLRRQRLWRRRRGRRGGRVAGESTAVGAAAESGACSVYWEVGWEEVCLYRVVEVYELEVSC